MKTKPYILGKFGKTSKTKKLCVMWVINNKTCFQLYLKIIKS